MKNKYSPILIALALIVQMISSSCAIPEQKVQQPERLLAASRSYEAVLQELANDLIFEVGHIDSDSIPETKEERDKFIKEFTLFLEKKSNSNPTNIPGKSWSNLWPPPSINLVGKGAQKPNLEKITIPTRGNLSKHSIENAEEYAANRLGQEVFEQVKTNRLTANVFGGDVEGFLSTLSKEKKAFRISSLYESWGIHKILVVDAKGNSVLHFIVPPIREYISQYGYLLMIAGAHDIDLILDLNASKQMTDSIDHSYQGLLKQLKGKKPTHVFIGYASQLEAVVRKNHIAGNVKKLSQVNSLGGFVLESTDELGHPTTTLGVTSGKTLWGEGTEALVTAILKENPRSIYFMGSAGTLNPNISIYSISVPESFRINDQDIPIENDFEKVLRKKILPKDKSIAVGAKHGSSVGPAEQSIEFTDNLIEQEIDTVDVEQALVAKIIAEHNLKNPAHKISFGAANIITDRPATSKYPATATHNLDTIDKFLKQQRRLTILELMLESSHEVNVPLNEQSCVEIMANIFENL